MANPIDLVTEFCHCLAAGDMAATCSYLTEDVVYHNMPWAPVVGHAAVRKVLDPLGPRTRPCAAPDGDLSHRRRRQCGHERAP